MSRSWHPLRFRSRRVLLLASAAECSKPAVIELSGSVLASPGIPQGNVKSWEFVA